MYLVWTHFVYIVYNIEHSWILLNFVQYYNLKLANTCVWLIFHVHFLDSKLEGWRRHVTSCSSFCIETDQYTNLSLFFCIAHVRLPFFCSLNFISKILVVTSIAHSKQHNIFRVMHCCLSFSLLRVLRGLCLRCGTSAREMILVVRNFCCFLCIEFSDVSPHELQTEQQYFCQDVSVICGEPRFGHHEH